MRVICASVARRAPCRGVVSVITSPYCPRAEMPIVSTALVLQAAGAYADCPRAPRSDQSHPHSGRNTMESALVIGNGQIGSEIAAQLSAAGLSVRIATRSGGRNPAPVGARTAEATPPVTQPPASTPGHTTPVHIKADASDRDQLARAARSESALVIGNGQIGSEIAAQLSAAGLSVRIATRSGGRNPAPVGARTAEATPPVTQPPASTPGHTTPVHIKADASDRDQLARAA